MATSDQLFQAALEREPKDRAAFISEACEHDDSLRREVEALLAADREAESLIEAPAYAVAAPLIVGDDAQLLAGKSISHYQIISLVGKGGMGEVYLAQDIKLDRKVAIKLLPTESSDSAHANIRLIREAKAAARLDHPNICSIYEVGEDDGRTFIVMQYVEGETLSARIYDDPLELREVLDVASQAARALAEAHSRGIIHRDIKPQNVMLTQQLHVKVMDFGLAKLVKSPSDVDSSAQTDGMLTTPGVIVGTVPYMSPEQLRGDSLDTRSDTFGFGIVLYEMITLHHPFPARGTTATVSAILTKEPLPLSAYSDEVPAELQRIVNKALAKDRELRYQSMHEVAVDLKNCLNLLESGAATTRQDERLTKTLVAAEVTDADPPKPRLTRSILIAIAVVVVISAGLFYFITSRNRTVVQTRQIKSLAVLPLRNLSDDPSQDYFADGMTEAIIGNLALIHALRVVSPTSVMRFKGSSQPLADIAQELGVDGVIEGSVQRVSGRVKIMAHLIHASTDAQLWAHDYEGDLEDVIKLQSSVARSVAEQIRIQITAEERARLASARTINPQAHEAYLLGRYQMRKLNEDDLRAAIEHFERAIRLEPEYEAAFAGLAAAWLERAVWGAKQLKEVEGPVRRAALRAIELDSRSSEAHLALGRVKGDFDWDWSGAESEFKRALELDPTNVDAHKAYAYLLMALERHDEAIREVQSAEQQDPLSSNTRSTYGRVLYRARKYDEAIVKLKRAIELDPNNSGAKSRLGDVYVQVGKFDEARIQYEEVGGYAERTGVALILALTGRRREAIEMIDREKWSTIGVAAVRAAVGDKDGAFKILSEAVEERNSVLSFLKAEPRLESLHSDPRWPLLLRLRNFPSGEVR